MCAHFKILDRAYALRLYMESTFISVDEFEHLYTNVLSLHSVHNMDLQLSKPFVD